LQKSLNMQISIQKKEKTKMGLIKDILIGGFVLGGTLLLCNYISSSRIRDIVISKSYVDEDFNKDGIADLVVEKENGYKLPLFGFIDGSDIVYVSAHKMKKRFPNAVTDYALIEKNLNKN